MSWDVIGQDEAVGVLRRAVADEARLSHAYLFAGPEHTGKATAARQFAQALNCQEQGTGNKEQGIDRGANAHGDPSALRMDIDVPVAHGDGNGVQKTPCGQCRTCRLIAEGKHPDVEYVTVGGVCDESEHKDHSADNSRDIRICQIRRIERVVSLTAVDARYRVLIVDPAEAMTVDAANAFLKTLEEPAPHTVLVLIASREEALPETVRSRCRRVTFGGVARDVIERALQERWSATPEQAQQLARLAQGRLGWAVAALEDEKLLIERARTVDEIESLMSGGLSERFAYAASLGARFPRDPQAVRATLELWRAWWRDVLLAAAGREELVAERERLDTLRSLAAQWGVEGAVRALAAVGNGRQHLEEHANATLALEVMLLEVPLSPSAKGRS
ncbi:MAG: hypothetical protein WEB04_06520 [Dehalococcoidia bacterium]